VSDKKDKTGLSRREFMKAAGITAAGVVATSLVGNKVMAQAGAAPAAPSVVGANERLNYAIIGVGGMGRGHLDHLKALSQEQNLQIVAVCDVWDKRRLGSANDAGIPEAQSFRDYRKVLENKDIDVVVIGTPDHWHAPIAIAAMQAGKHVYCEKPMTHTLDEAFKMHKTAKETGKLVQVGSQGCTDTKWHVAGQAVKDGKIGTVLWAQGGYCRNNPNGEWNWGIDESANESNLDWKMWLGSAPKRAWDPDRYFRWRKFWDYGNGIIGDLWPHRLHPLMIAMNNMDFPHRVVCLGANIMHTDQNPKDPQHPFGEERDVADATQMIAEFPNGSMIYLAGSTVNERGPEDIIRGNKGCMFFGGGKVTIEPERPWTDEIERADLPVVGPGEDQREHHRNLIKCIREGGIPNCNIDLALRVQTIVSMAEASYRQSKMSLFDPVKQKLI
jgi:predicted dehydrogenase